MMHRINKITFNRVNIIFYRMVDQTQTSIARKRQSEKKKNLLFGLGSNSSINFHKENVVYIAESGMYNSIFKM